MNESTLPWYRPLPEASVNQTPITDSIGGNTPDISFRELVDLDPNIRGKISEILAKTGITKMPPRVTPHYSSAVLESKKDPDQPDSKKPKAAYFVFSGILGTGVGIGQIASGVFHEASKEVDKSGLAKMTTIQEALRPALVATIGSSISTDTGNLHFVKNIWHRAAYQAGLIAQLVKEHEEVTDIYLTGHSLGCAEIPYVAYILNELYKDEPQKIKGILLAQPAGQVPRSLQEIAAGVPSVMALTLEKQDRFPTPAMIREQEVQIQLPEGDPRAKLYAERRKKELEQLQKRAYGAVSELKTIDEKMDVTYDRELRNTLQKKRNELISKYLASQTVDKRSFPLFHYFRMRHARGMITRPVPEDRMQYLVKNNIPVSVLFGEKDQYFPNKEAYDYWTGFSANKENMPDTYTQAEIPHGEATVDPERFGKRVASAVRNMVFYKQTRDNNVVILHDDIAV